eukprot:TRINITY_DN81335_c0_g1_i1.p1 TRINITY_DN81335_c0_g1~~TRINITY_DN81335_c0_g1_i1.p1  ORF type:complete len:507 (-),score=161.87 TRINITY_DN81335_c0_g1_i1:148-1668(-)
MSGSLQSRHASKRLGGGLLMPRLAHRSLPWLLLGVAVDSAAAARLADDASAPASASVVASTASPAQRAALAAAVRSSPSIGFEDAAPEALEEGGQQSPDAIAAEAESSGSHLFEHRHHRPHFARDSRASLLEISSSTRVSSRKPGLESPVQSDDLDGGDGSPYEVGEDVQAAVGSSIVAAPEAPMQKPAVAKPKEPSFGALFKAVAPHMRSLGPAASLLQLSEGSRTESDAESDMEADAALSAGSAAAYAAEVAGESEAAAVAAAAEETKAAGGSDEDALAEAGEEAGEQALAKGLSGADAALMAQQGMRIAGASEQDARTAASVAKQVVLRQGLSQTRTSHINALNAGAWAAKLAAQVGVRTVNAAQMAAEATAAAGGSKADAAAAAGEVAGQVAIEKGRTEDEAAEIAEQAAKAAGGSQTAAGLASAMARAARKRLLGKAQPPIRAVPKNDALVELTREQRRVPFGDDADEPFDCAAGLNIWQKDWSDDKQEWCCKHHNFGCHK